MPKLPWKDVAVLIFVLFAYVLAPEIVGIREIVGDTLLFRAPILLILHGDFNNSRKRRIAVLLSILGLFFVLINRSGIEGVSKPTLRREYFKHSVSFCPGD